MMMIMTKDTILNIFKYDTGIIMIKKYSTVKLNLIQMTTLFLIIKVKYANLKIVVITEVNGQKQSLATNACNGRSFLNKMMKLLYKSIQNMDFNN